MFRRKPKESKINSTLQHPVVVVLVFAFVIAASWLLRYQYAGFGKGTITIGDTVVQVEIAATDKTRALGLSGREMLADGHGVVFLFNAADRYSFWMKDMHFPIDAIWLLDGEIVDISLGIEPPRAGAQIPVFSPREPANAVLEVNAGFAAENGLRLGMPVELIIDRKGALR